MLRIRIFARIGIAIVLTAGALGVGTAPEPSSKLVVLIVIDQMRADYLTRFADLYQGGLKRFMEKGAIFTEAHHDHGLPGTGAGHATIATGVFPSRHGIPSNRFWDRTEGRIRPSTEDTTVSIVGFPDRTGRAPTSLRREGFSDWLKRDSPGSKVYSIAGKDRVAVLLAGQRPDGAYWYHKGSGRFVTSTSYTDA